MLVESRIIGWKLATFWLPEQILGTSEVASLPISSAELATGVNTSKLSSSMLFIIGWNSSYTSMSA